MALPTASDNAFPSLLITEGTEPAAPASGKQRLYLDSTSHLLSLTNSAGVQYAMPGSGSAFPTAATNDRFFRTDLGMEFLYNGTRWLCICPHDFVAPGVNPSGTSGYVGASVSLGTFQWPAPWLRGGSDIWLESIKTDFFVNGGTALGASHKWVGAFSKGNSANADTTVATVTIASGSSSVWREDIEAINALQNNGTTYYGLQMTWTKTGTPGDLYAYLHLSFRVVAT